jgi:acetyltransferase-like isoleucine patch superfamily enzyme
MNKKLSGPLYETIRGLRGTARLLANHIIIPSLRIILLRWSGITIGKNSFINMDFLAIDDYRKSMIFIEDEVAIAPRVTIVAVSIQINPL